MINNQTNTKVLIIDDDRTLCEMYNERLKAEGFQVKIAFDGKEGLSKAVGFRPDVILLDLKMPKMSGFEVLEKLKSKPETKNIPVIVLTALIQEENKTKALQIGASDYIIKSQTMPGEVIDRISKVIAESGK